MNVGGDGLSGRASCLANCHRSHAASLRDPWRQRMSFGCAAQCAWSKKDRGQYRGVKELVR
jgi:hypothetical protein